MKNTVVAFIVISVSILSFGSAAAQNSKAWNRKLNSLKYFIENKGQFGSVAKDNSPVLFGYIGESQKFFFTENGITIRTDRLLNRRNPASFLKKNESEESRKEKMKTVTDYIYVTWPGSCLSPEISPSEYSEGYYTFGMESTVSKGFRKITYKNLYPGVDFEFAIPGDSAGIKYNIIVHPGADISKVSVKYSGDVRSLNSDGSGNIIINSSDWKLTEHAPYAICEGKSVSCNNYLDDGIIRFSLPDVNSVTSEMVIDPWVTGISLSTEDIAYDVDYDNDNNLYAFIRPVGGTEVYINKYSVSGSLIWTHLSSYDFQMYDGNFAVEKNSSKVYIGEGFNASGARLYRLGANGIADGFCSVQDGNFREIWDIGFLGNGDVFVLGGGTSSNANGGKVNLTTGSLNAHNFTGIGGTCQDIVSYAIDAQDNLFVIYASSSDIASQPVNNKISLLNASFTGYEWMDSHYMTGFNEISNHWPALTTYASTGNNFNALAVNDNYLLYYDGLSLAAYDKTDGSMITSTSVGLSGNFFTPLFQGGIAFNRCNGVYLGGDDNVVLNYNFNGTSFTLTGVLPLGWAPGNQPFDIKYDVSNSLLFVSGRNYVGVYNPNDCNHAFVSAKCTGTNESTVSVSVKTSESNPVITYTWYDTGGTVVSQTANSTLLSDTVTGLPDGEYYVNAQFGPPSGLLLTDTVTVFCPVCYANVIAEDITCFGNNDGSAEIVQGGGVSPFTYQWYPEPGTGQGTAQAGNLAMGVYTVSVADDNGCIYTENFTILEPTADIALFTYSIDQNVVSFYNYSSQGTYLWDFGNGTTSMLSDPVCTFDTSGTYNICLYVITSCDTITFCKQLSLVIVNNPAATYNEVKIYPNPASKILTVDFGDSKNKNTFIEFTDKTGRVLYSATCKTNKKEIDVSGLTQGMYFLSVDGTVVKIVIER